jgi:Fic family protein
MRSSAGQHVPLPPPYGDHLAFIPDDLPPPISYTPKLAALLAQAEWAVGGLAAVGHYLPNPRLLVAPLQRVEAVLSSRIEGTRTTPEELFRAEAIRAEALDDETVEVMAYLQALDLGVSRVRERPDALDLELVCELHRTLMEGPHGRGRSPGTLREVTAWVGGSGRSIAQASYVPPPWQQVGPLMERWEGYVQGCMGAAQPTTEQTEAASPLVQCALIHAQFEMIHPFRDGNGRIGRLIMLLFLLATGRIDAPVLPLSAYFERHRAQYYARLQAISERGDWIGWLAFFLEAVQVQSERAVNVAQSVGTLRDQLRVMLTEDRAPAYVLTLLDLLLENPYTTIERVSGQLAVSFPTASKAVSQLQRLGIVHEMTGRRRGRQFCATALLEQIEALAEPERGR